MPHEIKRMEDCPEFVGEAIENLRHALYADPLGVRVQVTLDRLQEPDSWTLDIKYAVPEVSRSGN